MNVTKIWINLAGNVVATDKDNINAGNSAQNRLLIVTPYDVAVGQTPRAKFQLANGQALAPKLMLQDPTIPTETYNGETWNRYYYDILSDVLVQFDAAKYSYVDFNFQVIELNSTGLDTVVFNADLQRLKLGNSVADADSSITIDDKLELDLAISALDGSKLNKAFEGLLASGTLDGTELIAIRVGTTNYKITVANLLDFLQGDYADLDTRVTVLEGYVDQDVSIGSTPAFDKTTQRLLEVRDALTGHLATLEYDDAANEVKFTGDTDESFDWGINQDLRDTASPTWVEVLADTLTLATGVSLSYDGSRVIITYPDGTTDEIDENLYYNPKVQTGFTVTEGQVVQFAGTDGASGHLLVKPAVASEINTNYSFLMGIATTSGTGGQVVKINDFGQIHIGSQLAINGTPSSSGILYYDSTTATAGKLTYDKPVAPNVQCEMASLVYINPANTILQVRVNLGNKLVDLHDVYTNGGLNLGDILAWNASTNRWENVNLLNTGNTLINSSFLPSYVDDVLEYADFASLPATGETGKIYVTLNDNAQYRWSGSAYINTNGTAEQTSASATNFGKLFKDASITNVQEALDFIDDNVAPALDGEPNGFVNRANVTFAFDNGTRTLTLTGTFSFYTNGIKYTKTNDSYVLPDLEGEHYIYYNNSGVLTSTQAFSDDLIERWALVQYVYWDATNKVPVPNLLNETHGIEMPAEVHHYLHRNFSTQYVSGIGLTLDAEGSGALDSHAQFSSSVGLIDDEDIQHTITARTLTTNIPVLYRDGATNWRVDETNSFPVINTGTGRAAYNENVGGLWQLTEVTNQKYLLTHIYALPNINVTTGRLIAIAGQGEYSSISDARQAAEIEASVLEITGFPVAEIKLVATIICQTSSTYSNTPKTRFVQTDTGADYIDWRTSTPTSTGAISASQWGTITGDINDQLDLKAAIDANTTVLYTDEYEILTTDEISSFTYSKNGGGSTAGTISGGFYIFPDLTGLYKVNTSRIQAVVNNDLTYFTIDTELQEGTGDVDNNTQEVQLSGLIANDTVVFKYYQGNDVVAVNIGADTVSRTELTASVEAELDASIAHQASTANPHTVTKTQVGLGNVDNTSDLNKPISTATQTALDLKANVTYADSLQEQIEFNDLYGGI